MADSTGNGAAPLTLEQLAHAFREDQDVNRQRFGDYEGRWGKHETELGQLQRDQRGVVDDVRDLLCRFDSYLLAEQTSRTEAVALELKRHQEIQAKLSELTDAVRVLVDRKAIKAGRRT